MTGSTVEACRRRLAAVWFGFVAFLFVLLVAQSLAGKFGSRTSEAWSWFLPNVMPTLSLILGVLVASVGAPPETRQIEPFYFRLALVISTLYLAALAAVFLVQPLTHLALLELMKTSMLWLAPLQGLAAGALGVFFTKRTVAASE